MTQRANFSLGKICGSILLTSFLFQGPTAFSQTGWTKIPSPNPSATQSILLGISGTSSSNVWAVGFSEPSFGVRNNMMMRWTGTSWQSYSIPNPVFADNELWDVAAISANEAWVVGMYNNSHIQLLKWNGTTWQPQTVANEPTAATLFGIDARTATDIWAVGGRSGVPALLCYALHYNGSTWTEVPVPAVGLTLNSFYAVDAVSANSAWAVGSRSGDSSGQYRFLAMHWNGSTWSNVPMSAGLDTVQGELMDVKAISDSDVWATAYTLAGGSMTLHYNGSSWTQVSTGAGRVSAIAAIAANDMYVTGSDIAHYNGAGWSIADTLNAGPQPDLTATAILPGGEIWAAGRQMDAAGNYQTLVYRKNGTVSTSIDGSYAITVDAEAYPNPCADVLSLRITSAKQGHGFVTVSSISGTAVFQKDILLVEGDNIVSLNLPLLPAGIYALSIKTDNGTRTVRIAHK